MIIILLIVLIIVIIENDKLRNEIKLLKNNQIKYCPKCGTQLIKDNNISNNTINSNTTNNNYLEQKVDKKIEKKQSKPKMTDQEVKNNIILITGSILIILAAVIYLTTSWTKTSNILKCMLIFILFFVFVIVSYLAKNKLKLNQTSRAFKYIALAYLPLSLISVSIFGLLGEKFSINGTYQDFYFAFTFFITSIIYYKESIISKDLFLSIATIITQVLGIIFTVRIFNGSLLVLLMFMYLYSYFLAILYEKEIYIYDKSTTKIIINIIFYTLLFFLVISILNIIFEADKPLNNIIQSIILVIQNIGLAIYLNNKQLNRIIIPISIFIIFNSICISYEFSYIVRDGIVLLSILFIYLYNYLTEKNINLFNFIFVSIIAFSIFIAGIIQTNSIPSYITIYIYTLLLGLTYYLSSNYRKAIAWMIPIFIEFGTILLLVNKNYSINILLILSISLIALSFIPKLKEFTKELVIIPSVLNVIYILIAYSDKSLLTTLLIIISIIIYYLLFLNSNKNYKYLLYVFINLGMIYIGHLICNGLNSYTMALALIIIIALEVIDERLKDKGNFIFIIIDYIVTAFALTIPDKRTAFMMILIIAAIFISYLIDNNKNKELYIIPFLTPILYIQNTNIMTFNNINFMIIIAIAISIIIPFLTLIDKRFITTSFIPYIYLLSIIDICSSIYIPLSLITCISIIYYIFTDKKLIFKIVLLLSILSLYYQIIFDNNIQSPLFTIGILLIYTLIITRNIMKKNIEDSKIIEYILFILLNIIAITLYKSEVDGMLFVILILIITIYSYLKKYGPAFIVSIVFILINMFLLTRMFWLSLPWWIYVLGVGIILILFAITNEISEKDNVISKLKELKDNLKL